MKEILLFLVAVIMMIFQVYLWRLFAEFIGDKLGFGKFAMKVVESLSTYFKKEKAE